MDSGSESDQDSACSSSGEEAQYNSNRRSQSLIQQQQQQQQQAANNSQHAAAVAAEYQSMMKYMQQQQQQQNDQSRQDEQSQHQQQPMMMIPTNCLPFMVPSVSSYQMMMQSQGGMPSFFGQNAASSPSSRESEAATGSPLNLQTTREDRPSSRSRPVDFQNQSMAQQQFTHDQQQQVLPPAARAHQQVANASQSSLSRSSPQSGLPCSLPSTMSMSGSHLGISQDHQMAQQTQQSGGNFSLDFSMVGQRQEPPKPEHPAPPKRPLTPYMRFSKCMWQQVKSSNPGMSVCEIGATIGRMWRELPNEEKQKHNEDFTLDKVRYDTELKSYLKSTGLHASDLVKSKSKKKEMPAKTPVRRPAPPQPPRPVATNLDSHQVSNQQQHQQQHLSQSLLGLQLPGMGGTLPMGVGVSMGMLPGFPQMWAAPGQQYPSQQMLASMNMAGQLQFAQQQAQGLYNNGGATTAEQGSATSQLTSGTEGSQLPPVYLYSPGYM